MAALVSASTISAHFFYRRHGVRLVAQFLAVAPRACLTRQLFGACVRLVCGVLNTVNPFIGTPANGRQGETTGPDMETFPTQIMSGEPTQTTFRGQRVGVFDGKHPISGMLITECHLQLLFNFDTWVWAPADVRHDSEIM